MSSTHTPTFQAEDFVDRVLAVDEPEGTGTGGPVRVIGVADRTLVVSCAELTRAASRRALDLVMVDLASGEGAFASAVRARAAAGQGRRVDAAVMRLAESLDGGELGSRAQMEAIGRLWRVLMQRQPALLLVVNIAGASPHDRALLDFFVHHVYSDPVGLLVDDPRAWSAPGGRLVVTAAYESDVVRDVDFGDRAETAVRAYLATDEVVRRFIASTEGDLSRLERLVDDLPSDTSHLALFRYERLDEIERTLVDVLAFAGQPLSPDLLHDAASLLGASEFFARSLRQLENVGMLRRVMGHGHIAVAVEDADFAEALRQRLDDARKREVHRAIADAECARKPQRPNAALVALNYCAAGELELAAQHHVAAVGQLRRERRLPTAVALVEQLAQRHEGDQFELLLVELFEEMGEFWRALDACGRVTEVTTALQLRRGTLAARIGDWAQASEAFDRVLGAADSSEADQREALLGRADAEYSLGAHDVAVALLTTLIDELDSDGISPSVRDRMLVAARNTLGKIAIVRSQFADATELFEQNHDLAARWGWDEEVSRADANLGVVALHRDDHDEALQRLTAALATADLQGVLPRAYCLMNLATVYQRRGVYAEALVHSLDAMRCAKTVGDQNAYMVATRNLATIYADIGDTDRAWTLVEHIDTPEQEQTLGGGWNALVRGQLELDTGRFEAAEQTFERLRGERLNAVFGVAASLRLAEVYLALGQVSRSRELLAEVEVGERALYHGLAVLLAAQLSDDATEALELACVAWETLDEVGQRYDATRARLVMAKLLVEAGREAQARTELQRELSKVRRVAECVPEELRHRYWSKPAHRQLVARLRTLDGDVPPDVTETHVVETTHVAETREPHAAAPVPPEWRKRFEQIVGNDERLIQLFRRIDKVAKSDATVLTYGESGVGKELVAEAIHANSLRRAKPFIKVNCGAFVENLLLSELFGHEKGAFTGATETKPGRFERADGGTLFLDEIGDISLNTQVALLRVLQEGTFERVGGVETLKTNVRVICATNKDLEAMVQRGEFRLDLYYRLKGVVIEMPPLRERRLDIPLLAEHFAALYGEEGQRFTVESLQLLSKYSWPGNVRELQNFVRSIVLFSDGPTIPVDTILEFSDFFVSGEIDHALPDLELPDVAREEGTDEREGEQAAAVGREISLEEALVERIVREGQSLADVKKLLEIECIRKALITTGGNVTQAADLLQMKRPRLSQIINGDEELSALKTRLAG